MMKFHKAVWGGPDYSEGPEGVAQAVDRLASSGFELIIPFVENEDGSVKYHSKRANIDSAFRGWDMLAVLTDKSEKAGMKVHPCLNPFLGGEGSLIKDESLYVRNRAGEIQSWLCPASEEVRKLKHELYDELMDIYPIAGVHLDVIRYRKPDECYCERCRSGFKTITGIDPIEIGNTWDFNKSREHAQNRKHPGWAQWVEWRAGWVTKFVEELSGLVDTMGRELSAAVFMEYPECIVYQGQDWADWGERGLVDYIFPMTYTNSTLMVKRRTRNHIAQVNGGCAVWEGLGKGSSRSDLSTEALVAQIKASAEEGAEGIVIFAYSSLTDTDLKALSALD